VKEKSESKTASDMAAATLQAVAAAAAAADEVDAVYERT
jgi:hypothetical protein